MIQKAGLLDKPLGVPGMRLPRVYLPTWPLRAVAGAAIVPVAFDIPFTFRGAPLAFRLRATRVTAIPLALSGATDRGSRYAG